MPKHNISIEDPLDDFTIREITLNDVTKTVYVAGEGSRGGGDDGNARAHS